MKHPSRLSAPAPRPTRAAALLLGCALSVPVFAILTAIERAWF